MRRTLKALAVLLLAGGGIWAACRQTEAPPTAPLPTAENVLGVPTPGDESGPYVFDEAELTQGEAKIRASIQQMRDRGVPEDVIDTHEANAAAMFQEARDGTWTPRESPAYYLRLYEQTTNRAIELGQITPAQGAHMIEEFKERQEARQQLRR